MTISLMPLGRLLRLKQADEMLYEDLMQRSADSNPIRVAASGAGWMGSGFASQMAQVPEYWSCTGAERLGLPSAGS